MGQEVKLIIKNSQGRPKCRVIVPAIQAEICQERQTGHVSSLASQQGKPPMLTHNTQSSRDIEQCHGLRLESKYFGERPSQGKIAVILTQISDKNQVINKELVIKQPML